VRSAKFILLLVLMLASASAGLGFICGGCGLPNFVVDRNEPSTYQDSLRLSVALTDTTFSQATINGYIHLHHVVYPVMRPSRSLDSLRSLKRPMARVTVTNLSRSELIAPGPGSPYDFRGRIKREEMLEYSISWAGDTGASSVVQPEIEQGISADKAILGPYWKSDWMKLSPGKTAVLGDSIDILEVLEDRDLPSGAYKLVFYLSNHWRKHAGDNYWTGAIQSDTVRFYLRDSS
jgi:hypothetical protein